MKNFYEAYFGGHLSKKTRLFNMATLLSSVFTLLFVSIAFIMKISASFITMYATICLVSAVFFFLQKRIQKPELLALIYLSYCNFVAFPALLILAEKTTVEVPLYMCIGLTFSMILLDGWVKYVHFFAQLIIDVAAAYYKFVIANPGQPAYGALTPAEYARIEVAVVVTGLICGIIVFYRNSLLEDEMKLREEATKKAEMVSYAKDMFLVNVSHEIRTPLNAILGTTDLLLDSEASNHVKEMAYNISNSSHALLSITTDLLDFSRMNIDSIVPESEKYDIALMLNDIINLMSVRLLDSNVDFFVDVNPDLPRFMIGDSGKIRQIIINILSNAIKYTKEGHMTFYVDYEKIDNEKIHLFIRVEDTGIGIKKESIEKIFEPYNRSGEATDRIIEGNGLGLALCRKLASAMGGKIYAQSEYGKGSTFYFDVCQKVDSFDNTNRVGYVSQEKACIAYYSESLTDVNILSKILKGMGVRGIRISNDDDLFKSICDSSVSYFLIETSVYERIKAELADAKVNWKKIVIISGCNYSYSGEPFESVLTRPISSLNLADLINETISYALRKQIFDGKFSIPNAKVLVVDDNLVNLDVAAGILSRYKASVTTVASGEDAVSNVEYGKFDIIFLDYMMPGMDGIDTLKAIRNLDIEYAKTVPIISLTANVVSGAREMFLKEGFTDYLSKPIEIDSLEKVLMEHLDSNLIKVEV
ncbi:MAG: response regulator [Lachnospiraceae bacterium]|nr:response regulator [Lachnospiraceae bacterium]